MGKSKIRRVHCSQFIVIVSLGTQNFVDSVEQSVVSRLEPIFERTHNLDCAQVVDSIEVDGRSIHGCTEEDEVEDKKQQGPDREVVETRTELLRLRIEEKKALDLVTCFSDRIIFIIFMDFEVGNLPSENYENSRRINIEAFFMKNEEEEAEVNAMRPELQFSSTA